MLTILDDEELAPGSVVAAKYRLERIVGKGGMGVVWEARHIVTNKACALKFIHERRSKDPKNYERVVREARTACKVRHPNVATVHDLLELPNGAPFIVMDLLEGESLGRRLARAGTLDERTLLALLVPAIDGVLAAHAEGIIHRDLKPDNVFLEERGGKGVGVKILDFGLAKQTDVEEGTFPPGYMANPSRWRTSTYTVLGTPRYMPPEQAKPGARIGFAADVWALGVIAYEALTGTTPPPPSGAEKEPRRADEIRSALEARGARRCAKTIAAMLAEDGERRLQLERAHAELARALAAPRLSRGRAAMTLVVLAAATFALVGWQIGWTTVRAPAPPQARARLPLATEAASARGLVEPTNPPLATVSVSPPHAPIEPPRPRIPRPIPSATAITIPNGVTASSAEPPPSDDHGVLTHDRTN